jgi:4-hydroxy-tetrahydrodipicolinate reductase
VAVRIAIAGAGGRMGRMLIEAVLADPQAQLVAALDQPGNRQRCRRGTGPGHGRGRER